ncbi:hypothetical protein EVAR_95722_1 [Eumeta japonica]|uniref:Uncharacterized protein n=1 Tax=Eumeta variegata TaxID=151549 RepID=A0A4C1ULT5_EUMVA|nr:hypothetical protein EVAR_95722_1 [Eumeta japonica]
MHFSIRGPHRAPRQPPARSRAPYGNRGSGEPPDAGRRRALFTDIGRAVEQWKGDVAASCGAVQRDVYTTIREHYDCGGRARRTPAAAPGGSAPPRRPPPPAGFAHSIVGKRNYLSKPIVTIRYYAALHERNGYEKRSHDIGFCTM